MSNNWLKIARHLRLRKPYGYTGEWSGGYTHLLHLRARWYAPESGTFLSVDPVESEPPYQYVGGNVANRTDPSGFQSPEETAIELCKNLYWEADQRACEENASAIIQHSSPSPPLPPLAPSYCGSEKPCTVIVGIKQIGATFTEYPLIDGPIWHAFLLVADPNRVSPPRPVFDASTKPRLDKLITEPSTVYFFRGGPKKTVFDPLYARYGMYDESNPDGTENLDFLPQGGKYITIADDVSCPYILKCLQNVMDTINNKNLNYYFGSARNSNTVVSSALRRCGLNGDKVFLNPLHHLPQWNEDIDTPSWRWGFETDEEWAVDYPAISY